MLGDFLAFEGSSGCEERSNLRLAEPTMTAGGTNAADATRGCPSSDRFGVYSEQCSDLAGGQQSFTYLHVVFNSLRLLPGCNDGYYNTVTPTAGGQQHNSFISPSVAVWS